MTNEEKYKTPEERAAAFRGYCDRHMGKFNGCTTGNCPLRTTSLRACQFAWLSLEAEEEKPLACPFCGDSCAPECVSCRLHYVHCRRCGATTKTFDTKAEAIAAWNRRAEP